LYGRSRLADKLPPIANVVISNVPGPQFPLYLAGAKMTTYFPVSIVVHGIALNITVQSYNGSLDFGFTACRRALPGVRDLARHAREAFAELTQLAAAREESGVKAVISPAPAKPARKRAAKKSARPTTRRGAPVPADAKVATASPGAGLPRKRAATVARARTSATV
jgi:diacylglycerol O-acyltransferase / wax synthase